MATQFSNELVDSIITDINKIINNELLSAKLELERQFDNESVSSLMIEDIRIIQCLINEIFSINNNKRTPLLLRLKLINNKLEEVIAKIKTFYKNYNASIPRQIFQNIEIIINSCSKKITGVERITKGFEILFKAPDKQINLNSNKQTFETWADAIEIMADGVEEIIDSFPDDLLKILKNLAQSILIVSQKDYSKSASIRKEQYKRRLRFSVNYIITLVERRERENKNTQKDLRGILDEQYELAIQQMGQNMIIKDFDDIESEEELLSAMSSFIQE